MLEFELAGLLGTDFIELEAELVELLDKGLSIVPPNADMKVSVGD